MKQDTRNREQSSEAHCTVCYSTLSSTDYRASCHTSFVVHTNWDHVTTETKVLMRNTLYIGLVLYGLV